MQANKLIFSKNRSFWNYREPTKVENGRISLFEAVYESLGKVKGLLKEKC